ncbi:MAG: sigma-70 family RNA polymerase sigma factor [Blastocatellia bacterium]|nr:sigma-70 family RNA polymerase sigma factor [Blastocatellia bacterium]
MDNLQDNKKSPGVNGSSFDSFLEWLDQDPDIAAYKYGGIRRRLINFFARHRYSDPEYLADETIDRVIRKISEIPDSYSGDPAVYFYGVARLVHFEHLKKRPDAVALRPDVDEVSNETEIRLDCMQRCLENLSPENRELITLFYQEGKDRKHLAVELGISPTSLRVRMYRTKKALRTCIEECMKEK